MHRTSLEHAVATSTFERAVATDGRADAHKRQLQQRFEDRYRRVRLDSARRSHSEQRQQHIARLYDAALRALPDGDLDEAERRMTSCEQGGLLGKPTGRIVE